MAAFSTRGLTCIVIACFLLLAPTSEAAITCGTVVNSLFSCIPYVIGQMPAPSVSCRSGIKTLYAAAKTTADRQTVCSCLKGYARLFPGVNFSIVGSVPKKCGVNIPYPISPSVNCANIS